ncbi:dihydrofolate reductase family protein [Allorhizocola rhizosphaerae]|uniref:dihydrofolate reductase family protein n=1 Tax=Allorhizocola rhizosphaerae TaxID=1872709 RepID=UPI000E3C28BC|nr:dihydrofolate reductase family protein [Allorhizocola rhizosphaerae]
MSTVYTGASMSIDGFIAGPNETGFEHLFQWYSNGDVPLPTAMPEMTLQMTEVSHRHFKHVVDMTGALVVGRKLFDFTNAWGGRHPMDVPVVVLTHSLPDGWAQENESFAFVHDGIEAAIAKARELAGGKGVGLNGGTIASQALDAGLVDEIYVDLVPVLLGSGTPFFAGLASAPVPLEGPISVAEGKAVTHLRYQVKK